MKGKCISGIVVFLGSVMWAHAGEAAEPGVREEPGAVRQFGLGLVEIVVTGNDASLSANTLSRHVMRELNLVTVGQALATQPGVSLTRNARNEDIIAIRGFDARQVPVYLDGVPQYVPYDGYVDFSRFTTFDLAAIQISKGGASLLYGPNTLGGAINLVSRRPDAAFEGDLEMGVGAGKRRTAALNVGSNQNNWYLQGGLSLLEQDSFPLGDGFVDYKAIASDTGKYRENAWSRDWKVSLKLGYVPNATDEYAIGFSRQNGAKGNPVYTGTSSQGIRYWKWPYWDKDAVYLIGSMALGTGNTLKSRVYLDTYSNRIDAYTDASYTLPGQRSSFPSIYDDRNVGAALEWVNTQFGRHELHLAVHLKEDRHDEIGPDRSLARYRDRTTTLALEDVLSISPTTTLRLGFSHEQRDTREVHAWPPGAADAVNALAEVTHAWRPDLDVLLAASRKTRFPTIKDRYSARLGRALPNPDLRSESVLHLEAGVGARLWTGSRLRATVFQSHIDDLIQNSIVASPACGGVVCNQADNVGKARHRGIELGLSHALGSGLSLEAAWTLLDMDNLEDGGVPLTGAPRQRLFAHLRWSVTAAWEAILEVEAESGRTVPFDGNAPSNFRDLAGFANWGLKGVWRPLPEWSVEVGVDNLGDRSYELADGMPMPGASWFMNLAYDF